MEVWFPEMGGGGTVPGHANHKKRNMCDGLEAPLGKGNRIGIHLMKLRRPCRSL